MTKRYYCEIIIYNVIPRLSACVSLSHGARGYRDNRAMSALTRAPRRVGDNRD